MSNYFLNNFDSKNATYFKDIFNKYQTDKASQHGYHHIYSKLFYNKNNVKNIFEIGIGYGASSKCWREIYPDAKVFLVDNIEKYLINDINIFSMYADQEKIETFDTFRNSTGEIYYDIIIDDASHIFDLTYNTFLKVIPWMSDSGWYIIEDIKKEDVEKWKHKLSNFVDSYDIHYIDLNNLYPTPISDSFVVAISKKINREIGIISNVLKDNDFNILKNYFINNIKLNNMGTDEFGRKLLSDNSESILKDFSNILLPKAREFFNSNTLIPSYSLFAEYSSETISLHRHKDANACTYTLDLVLYQKDPWPIFVNDIDFLANENEAVMFMGEKYEHWRETKYNNYDKIGVVFFHYVEPDHWYFTEGPGYVEKIREQMRSNNASNN